METTTEIKLTSRKIKTLVDDPVKSAAAINLTYVSDKQLGINRIKRGKSFVYLKNGKVITDENELVRIKKLVIPPAWEDVWICNSANGHLQATGLDVKKRKQYRYHPLWNALRNHTKFYHLLEFGRALPVIRAQLQKDIAHQGLPVEKVLATIVLLMQCTCIRIGNSMYEKLYGSFGLTTLKDKHVKMNGNELKFVFKGKKGIHHDISLKSKKLVNIVKQCRDIPGQELFQYYDEHGDRYPVDSGMVNQYIKDISDGHFTAKDFRTWAGSLHALEAFKELGESNTITETKHKIVVALDMVASQLGNTRTVCKKYYVHPVVIDHYTNNTLSRYLNKIIETDCDRETSLSHEEQVLLKMLEDNGAAIIAA
jgi:DNA topoisomerase I